MGVNLKSSECFLRFFPSLSNRSVKIFYYLKATSTLTCFHENKVYVYTFVLKTNSYRFLQLFVPNKIHVFIRLKLENRRQRFSPKIKIFI